jgi:hypothetical protein
MQNKPFKVVNITTFKYIHELRARRDFFIESDKYTKNLVISDLYESPISISFRILDAKTKITKHFFQVLID